MEQNDDFLTLLSQPATGHLTIKLLEELFEKISSEKYKIYPDVK